MIRLTTVVLVAVGMVLASSAYGGEFNKKLSIGDNAPAFSGLEGVDGKLHGLDEFKNKDVVVICVTCNHCPVAVAYEDRIIDFCKKLCSSKDSKVGFIAINVNNLEQDKLPKMKERAKAKGFNFPYVYDPSQKVGRAYGASVTPEFFVLGKDRKVLYMGSLDDSQDPAKATKNYLGAAVLAGLNGKKPEKAETRPFGCSVKYETK